MCPKPDLVISEKYETADDGTFSVTYNVTNIGGGDAEASTTSITTTAGGSATDPVPALAAGESYTSTVAGFECPCGTTVTVTVCADSASVVDESNEDNNCLENDHVCPPCGQNESYGESVRYETNVWRSNRALDAPDNIGAFMYRNSEIAIELDDTIQECEKVSVWVRRFAFIPSSFDVAVSSDGENWTTVGSETCYSFRWTRYDFTGDWGNVKYIRIIKPGEPRRPKLMGLDAVYAVGR